MNRRAFMSLVGGAAAGWPVAARAQQPAMPVIGVLTSASVDAFAERMAALRQGIFESGFVEGQKVTIEIHSADGRNDRLQSLAADLGTRAGDQIASHHTAAAVVGKRATATSP